MAPARDDVGEFPTTAWSLVLSAGRGSGRALDRLFGRYRPVLLGLAGWFSRTRGLRGLEAEDLTQEFIVHVLANRERILGGASQEKGRFRAWLRACFGNWLKDRARHERAERRGGGRVVSLDGPDGEEARHRLTASDDVEREFDRRWAREVVARALAKLREDEESGILSPGDVDCFELNYGAQDLSARQISLRLDRSENSVVVALRRARRRLRERLRDEIAPTIATDADFTGELKYLLESLGR